jgi:hypothetical protein
MTDHAFKIGQSVDYAPKRLSAVGRGPYQIKGRLPFEDGQLKYRIKSPNEPHERVVSESELKAA